MDRPEDSLEPLLATEHVAQWLRVEESRVRSLVASGRLPAYRVAGEYRFKRGDVEKYLEERRVSTRSDGLTEKASVALVLAQEEAKALSEDCAVRHGTEHLLLGLMRSDGAAAKALAELGLGPDKLDEVRREVGPVGGQRAAGHKKVVGATSALTRVLHRANDEARDLFGHDQVGTGHLLLSLARELAGEDEALGAHVLRRRGIDYDNVLDKLRPVLVEGKGD